MSDKRWGGIEKIGENGRLSSFVEMPVSQSVMIGRYVVQQVKCYIAICSSRYCIPEPSGCGGIVDMSKDSVWNPVESEGMVDELPG